ERSSTAAGRVLHPAVAAGAAADRARGLRLEVREHAAAAGRRPRRGAAAAGGRRLRRGDGRRSAPRRTAAAPAAAGAAARAAAREPGDLGRLRAAGADAASVRGASARQRRRACRGRHAAAARTGLAAPFLVGAVAGTARAWTAAGGWRSGRSRAVAPG